MRLAGLLSLLALAALAAGCGRDRLAVPDVERPAAAGGTQPVAYGAAGVRLRLPRAWRFEDGADPLVTSGGSGTATVALWRYPRAEPLPRTRRALRDARKALEAAAKVRDQTFSLRSARITKVNGAPAIVLVGDQTVAGQRRRVKSTHAYAEGAELVLDAYAAEADFPRVNRAVFRRLARSLHLDAPRP